MGPSDSQILYDRAVVVDATAPLSPYAAIQVSHDPERLIDAYASAGVTLVIFTVVDDYPNSIEQTVKLIGQNRAFFLQRPDRFVLATGAEDVRRAKADHKLAVAFAFQGTNALLGDLCLVEVYRQLGVVQMLLAYNTANLAADGCHERRDSGLSGYGRRLLTHMNSAGVIVDLSHVGRRSSLEAMEFTQRPPLFSHSTPKRFAMHDRNITDDQIQACAARDGVICLTGVGLFMDGVEHRVSAARLSETIDYVVQLVGARHAGVGLDYILDAEAMASYLRANAALYGEGIQYPPDGRIQFAPPSILREVAEQLLKRGYSQNDVLGILGENYLRVLEANQPKGLC